MARGDTLKPSGRLISRLDSCTRAGRKQAERALRCKMERNQAIEDRVYAAIGAMPGVSSLVLRAWPGFVDTKEGRDLFRKSQARLVRNAMARLRKANKIYYNKASGGWFTLSAWVKRADTEIWRSD